MTEGDLIQHQASSIQHLITKANEYGIERND